MTYTVSSGTLNSTIPIAIITYADWKMNNDLIKMHGIKIKFYRFLN